MSQAGRMLAQAVSGEMNQGKYRDLFEFRGTQGPAPLLLILDRRNDPVTPLLTQWTYQAMVHELFGITNGRVHLDSETKPELRDLILSPSSDPFYSENLFSNFGDLGASIASYVHSYQSRNAALTGGKSNNRLETVADMKRFVEEYPEFKRLGGNVSKHVTIVGELSKVVERDGLLEVSEVEQSLASQESHAADLKVSRKEKEKKSFLKSLSVMLTVNAERNDPLGLFQGSFPKQTSTRHPLCSPLSKIPIRSNSSSSQHPHLQRCPS